MYNAEEEDEISFPEGAMMEVLQKSLVGWWLVRYNNTLGLAPATFLQKVESEENAAKVSSQTVTHTHTHAYTHT